jgi:hypothetical protein
MTHVGIIRWLARCQRSPQATPWIRMGDRFHRGALLDRGPYIYWYRADEAARMLQDAGFIIEAIATSYQLRQCEPRPEGGSIQPPPLPRAEARLREGEAPAEPIRPASERAGRTEPRADLPRTASDIAQQPMSGALYCVCRKQRR